MMSKKWAFSLTSLITIIALTFVVSSGMALTITPKLNADADDVSSKDGHQLQIEGSADIVKFESDEPLIPTASGGTLANTVVRVIHDTGVDALSGTVALSDNAKVITVTLSAATGSGDSGKFITVHLLPGTFRSLTTGDTNERASITLHYVSAQGTSANQNKTNGTADTNLAEASGVPRVYYIDRLDSEVGVPASADTIDIRIVLSEEPKAFGKDQFEIKQAKFVRVTALTPMDETDNDDDATLGNESLYDATGRDGKYHPFRLKIMPDYANKDAITIKVKKFEDLEKTALKSPSEPTLTINVDPARVADTQATEGFELVIPKDLIIPADGFLIVAKDDGSGSNSQEKVSESLIVWPGDPKEAAAKIALRKLNLQKYNMIEADLRNLETFLINGGTIDLIAPDKVVISEIMWGTDGSSQNRQWIEIMNASGKELKTGDKTYKLKFYAASETVPVTTTAVAAVPATATTLAVAAVPVGSVPADVADRVGTLYEGAYWSIAGRGKSGNIAGTITVPGQDVEVVGASSLISMQRGMPDAMGIYPDGTMGGSWTASTPPSQNFEESARGLLVGTPGAMPIISEAAKMADEAAAKAKATAAAAAADTSVMIPEAGQVYISEIMYAGGGILPQWIEIANGSATEEVNLSGWTLTIDNAAADAAVDVGATVKFTIPKGTKIGMSRQIKSPSTILIVTEAGRNNIDDVSDQVIVLNAKGSMTEVDLINVGVTKRKYSLLSSEAFLITLAPPMPKATTPPAGETAAAKARRMAMEKQEADMRKDATDMAGNLGADGAAAWALEMSEDGRSSIIRKHVIVSIGPSEPEDGMMAENWTLASDTAFGLPQHQLGTQTYYGAMSDEGTPGFRAGSALPVELSHFRPVRDKATGQVVITWSTQSELNNAGFFVKRSQQRNGEFKVINATMVPGAGTTSEKQFYTYTDTTAQPNVVYYYQIEDVSLDGNRQTLTRGIRLKGHVGAAGKATTLWGELKTSHE